MDHIKNIYRVLTAKSKLTRTRNEFLEWMHECDEAQGNIIAYLRNETDNLSIGTKRRITSITTRLRCAKVLMQKRFSGVGRGLYETNRGARASSLTWENIESAFENRILTGAVINVEHIDTRQFLKDARRMVTSRVTDAINAHNCIKVNAILEAEFMSKGNTDVKSFNTRNREVCVTSNLRRWYKKDVIEPILKAMEEFQERDSGWALTKILCLMVNVNKYQPMHAGCNISIPRGLALKKAIVNVKCNGVDVDACFFRSVVASLYRPRHNVDRVSSYPHYSKVLNTKGFQLPMTLKQIAKFERRNDVSVNVYGWNESLCEPLHLTSRKRKKHANLLLLETSTRNHFVCIRNLSRLVSRQINGRQHRKYICDRCLHYFISEEKLKAHTVDCQRINDCAITLPTNDNNYLRFENFSRKERIPFIIYADFECLLANVNTGEDQRRTQPYQHHRAYSVGYYLHCSYDASLCKYRSYRDESDCIEWFVKEMRELGHRLDSIFRKVIPMTRLTAEEEREFHRATICHICENPFLDETKVRDHCHLSGAYRGPAHSSCNLNYKIPFTVPVVFHNLSGYDAHFVIKELATAFNGKVDLLPITKEKYISFTKHMDETRRKVEETGGENVRKMDRKSEAMQCIKFQFIDSFKFLSSSLDKLASYLEKDKLKNLRTQFHSLSNDDFDLLTRKGIFPYDYVTSYDKLSETRLPDRDAFYNRLNDSDISDTDYAHAVNVWTRFHTETLGQYSDLYLKIDVMLLADIFENFRNDCIESYKLDPAHYFTLPGFAWDVMLKYTKITLTLLTDIDMYMFVERGIRGGLSQCSHRYSHANNKYMATYDPSKPSTYLMYFDVNNLYGWAMSQPLPHGAFQWIEGRSLLEFDVNSVSEDGPVGYILEVDLEYPRELHDSHVDLPFCPLQDTPPGKRGQKLLVTVNPKERYVIHYRYLQQCLRHGLKLTKIHRILEFQQSCWLRKYIDLNTQFRTRATNDFQKNLFKLMNNAVFGKTMENVRNHRDVKLVTRWDGRFGAEALIAKPNFHSRTIFSEDVVAIELSKLNIKLCKPAYVGMCILDISKVCLYDFHYGYMQSRLPGKSKIMYTDTDSLIYELECDDAYEEIIKRDIDRFDTSDYAENNPYRIPRANKKVLGMMKDENNGSIMSEFVGLRAKMYAFRVSNCDGVSDSITKKIKGVKRNVTTKSVEFDDYLRCLNDKVEKIIIQNRIASKGHNVYTIRERKLALSPHDDKRFIVPGSTRTLPWGHYAIDRYIHKGIK